MKEPRKKACFLSLSFAGPDQGLKAAELLFEALWLPSKKEAISQELGGIWLSSWVPTPMHTASP